MCGVNAAGRIVVSSPPGDPVTDLLYLALTVGFFALMLGYVRACAALAASDADAEAGGTR